MRADGEVKSAPPNCRHTTRTPMCSKSFTVAQTSSMERHAARTETIQGFNIRRWSDRGLNFWAVSDLGKDELADFGERFESAMRAG